MFTSFADAKPTLKEGVIFLKFQQEECPESGRIHYQGVFKLAKPARLGGAKDRLGCGREAHLEICKDWAKAKLYCEKDESAIPGTREEHGEDVGQGHRSELVRIQGMFREGKRMRDVAEEYPAAVVRYHKGLNVLRQLLIVPKTRLDLQVIVLWGETGTGKSRYVHDRFPDVYVVACCEHPWVDTYDGQEVALMDDFRGGLSYQKLLQMLDIYKILQPTKGAFSNWDPRRIYITSNHPPRDWYPAEQYAPLARRCHEIHNVVAGFDFSVVA